MKRLLLALLIISPALHAATYIVPTDAEMIAASEAIVTGTVVDAYPRRAENGLIETITRIAVEERVKGIDAGTRFVEIVQWGGQLGDEWMAESGAPSFTNGERVLLFLRRNARGEWTSYGLSLGVFRFDGETLSRGDEISGFDEDGNAHVEQTRNRSAFLAFVRGETATADYFTSVRAARPIQSHANFTSGSYTSRFVDAINTPIRRTGSGLTVAWRLFGTQNDLDLAAAVDAGSAAWNAHSPSIHYSRSSSPASAGRSGDDSEARVIANDPFLEIDQTCCPGAAAVAFWFGSGATHRFNGETFRTITHADIVVNRSLTLANTSQQLFNTIITHELGHSLGLRHSDQDNRLVAACAPPLDCCVNTSESGNCRAIMNHVAIPGLDGPQNWDKKAIACVYDAACVSTTSCDPLSILTSPLSRSLPPDVTVVLFVDVSGTLPLSYQWYVGSSGDTSMPVGTNARTLGVETTVTTSYWVRVSDSCGNRADSATATLTIVPCPLLEITTAMAVNRSGNQISLRSSATGLLGLAYEWFRGSTPGRDGVSVGVGNNVNVTINERTPFWMRVTNSCGATAVSDLVFADLCGLPSIVTQPVSPTIASGENATLAVTAMGGEVTWYRGWPPDKSHPVGAGASVNVGPLRSTTNFWATVTNACGEIPVRAVTVNVMSPNRPGRSRSIRH